MEGVVSALLTVPQLLKDCADELDLGIQYHLTRYAFMYESSVVTEGSILCPPTPEDGMSLKQVFESIDNRSDFKSYMQNYAVARNIPKGPRREGPYDENFVRTISCRTADSRIRHYRRTCRRRRRRLGAPSFLDLPMSRLTPFHRRTAALLL